MRIIARLALALFIFALLSAGGLLLVFTKILDTESLRAQIEPRISALTGGVCRIEGGITFSLYPWLALTMDDFVLSDVAGSEVVRVDEVHAAVRILPLLSRSIEFETIELSGPSVTLHTTANGTMPWRTMLDTVKHAEQRAVADQTSPGGLSVDNLSLTGISVENGLFEWLDDSAVDGSGKTQFVKFSRVDAAIDIASSAAWRGSFLLEGSVVPCKLAVSGTGGADFSGEAYVPEAVYGTLKTKGSLTVEGRDLPLKLETAVRYVPLQQKLGVTSLIADLDGLDVRGSFALANCTSEDWELIGTTELKDLSLPFWFGFGELLPPSLQHALDSLQGSLALRMNRRGVYADSLSVDIMGMRFSGKAEVADFNKPVVYVDVAGPNIDVNKVFPEIMETPPAILPKPKRPGPAVFSAQMEPDDNPDDDMGYDIRVRAQNATARSFSFEGLTFRCWPMPKTGTFTSYSIDSFYGGKVDALLSIRDVMGLDVTVNNVRTREVSKLIVGEPILGGALSGKASVQARAKTVWGMVAGLEGKLEASLTDGYIQTIAKRDGTKPKHAIDSFSLTLKGKSQHPNPDKAERYLPYMWALQTGFVPSGSTDRYDIQLEGPVIVDSRRALPVRTSNARAVLHWQGKDAVFDRIVPLDLSVSGLLNFDLEKETLDISGATAVAPGIRTACSISGKELLGKAIWDGSFDSDDIDLRSLFSRYGINVWQTADPRALSWAKGKAQFHAGSTDFSLQNMDFQIDGFRLTGGIACQRGKPFVSRYSLNVDSIDLDRYLPPVVNGTTEPAEPWDLSWLKKYDLAGELAVGKLIYKNLDFSSIAARARVNKGLLEVDPFTAGFYKGSFSGKLSGVLTEARNGTLSPSTTSLAAPSGGLDTHVALHLKNVDLELPATRFAGGDYIGGKAALNLDLKGMLRSRDDIPAAMSGLWGFDIGGGYYSIGTRNDGTRSRTAFDKASANGTMKNGVLKNDNMTLNSLLVSMEGRGEVDLVRKNVDYRINVTYAEIPTFPVRIYGPLNTPKTSISGVEAIPRTIGKLGGGLFNIFRRIIATPFQALELLGRLASNSTKAN